MNVNIVELATELAHAELESNYSDQIEIYAPDEDEESTEYTEEAQNIFDTLYDKYYAIVEGCKE